MLGGSVAGGFIAEQYEPWPCRSCCAGLILTACVHAAALRARARPRGSPQSRAAGSQTEGAERGPASIEHGWRAPAVSGSCSSRRDRRGSDLRVLRTAALSAGALGGSRAPTRSPGSWPRSSPARRSSAGWWRPGSAAGSGAAPRRCFFWPSQRCHAGADRPRPELLGGARNHRRLGAALLRLDADPKGVPQRAHPFPPACHNPVLGLADELQRQRLDTTAARPRNIPLGIRTLLPVRSRNLRTRPSPPGPPTGERPRGQSSTCLGATARPTPHVPADRDKITVGHDQTRSRYAHQTR